jgi:hypothetical protein
MDAKFTFSRIGPTGKISFRSLDGVKKVWRFTEAEIDAHEDYYGEHSIRVVALRDARTLGDDDWVQMDLFVKASPATWKQYQEAVALIQQRHREKVAANEAKAKATLT